MVFRITDGLVISGMVLAFIVPMLGASAWLNQRDKRKSTMSATLNERTRQELRQKLGDGAANHLLDVIDRLSEQVKMGGGQVAADINFLKAQEEKHAANVEALVDSNIKLQGHIDDVKGTLASLRQDVNAMRDPPPVTPPTAPAVSAP